MSQSAEESFTIVNTLGLHARAATKLVQLASRFPCDVELARDDQAANGKSVMGVLLLCGSQGTVHRRPRDRATKRRSAWTAIGELIANRFGEPS